VKRIYAAPALTRKRITTVKRYQARDPRTSARSADIGTLGSSALPSAMSKKLRHRQHPASPRRLAREGRRRPRRRPSRRSRRELADIEAGRAGAEGTSAEGEGLASFSRCPTLSPSFEHRSLYDPPSLQGNGML